jgi:hypothetical protein
VVQVGVNISIEQLIVSLCDQQGRVLTDRELGELGRAGDLLRRWGAVVRGDNLTCVACTSCGEDHPVELEYDPELRAWRYYCSFDGYVIVNQEDLVTFRFDREWLFGRLSEALRINGPDPRCLIEDVLWQLGTARTGTAFWTVFVARDVLGHLDLILGQLQQAGGGFSGLVLTSSPVVPHRVRLPNGHRWVPLLDLLDAGDGQLGVREAVIRAALSGEGARQLVPRPPGRPGVGDLVLEELVRRQQAGATLPEVGKEAAALQTWLRIAHPERRPRSKGRIENIIREPYAKWASREDPRSTK